MEAELERLRTELGRAYRLICAHENARRKGMMLADAAHAYHSLTIGAAFRHQTENALDGAEYFIGKKVDVLHAALRGEPTEPNAG